MSLENLGSLSISELCDLLVKNTRELLVLLNQKRPDGMTLFHKKSDDELIQFAIENKKSEKQTNRVPTGIYVA